MVCLPQGDVKSIRSVQHAVNGISVVFCKYHGQIKHRHFRDKINHWRSLAHNDIYIPVLSLTQQIRISSKVAVGMIVNSELSSGDLSHIGSHQFTEQLSRRTLSGGIRPDKLNRLKPSIGPGLIRLSLMGLFIRGAGRKTYCQHKCRYCKYQLFNGCFPSFLFISAQG